MGTADGHLFEHPSISTRVKEDESVSVACEEFGPCTRVGDYTLTQGPGGGRLDLGSHAVVNGDCEFLYGFEAIDVTRSSWTETTTTLGLGHHLWYRRR